MISLQELQERIEEENNELPVPRSRQITKKVKLSREPRTYNEEQLEEFYRKIVWTNSSFVRDSRAYFALCNKVKKLKGESTLIGTLRQIEKNGKLFPNYVIAVLSRILKNGSDL